MTSPEVIASTLKRMDDRELLERWCNGMFSEEALPIARAELEQRGIAIPDVQHESERGPSAHKESRLPAYLLYFGIFFLNVAIAGAEFAWGGREILGNIIYGFKYPDYFIDLLAYGLGAYLVLFFGGFIIELIASFFKKRRVTLNGSLLWSTALLFFVLIVP